jgi:hypothetical protein
MKNLPQAYRCGRIPIFIGPASPFCTVNITIVLASFPERPGAQDLTLVRVPVRE